MVAVIDESRSLHISYPMAKIVPTSLFIRKNNNPIVLRYNFESDQKRLDFVTYLQQNCNKKQYDFGRIIHYLIYSKIYPQLAENQKYGETDDKIVCSHHIFRALLATNPELYKFMVDRRLKL
jgi:hypothetical protein